MPIGQHAIEAINELLDEYWLLGAVFEQTFDVARLAYWPAEVEAAWRNLSEGVRPRIQEAELAWLDTELETSLRGVMNEKWLTWRTRIDASQHAMESRRDILESIGPDSSIADARAEIQRALNDPSSIRDDTVINVSEIDRILALARKVEQELCSEASSGSQ